jgi:hypothetical protein
MTATRKPTKAKPVPKLALTSRAKMGAARKISKATKKPLSLRQALRQAQDEVAAAHEQAHVARLDACAQAVEQIVAPVIAGIPGFDGDTAVLAEQVGEPVAPAIELTGVDFSAVKGVDPAAARQYFEMLASGVEVSPREVETTTGLGLRQRCKVDHALYLAGWCLKHRRNPERDKSDRHTANLYWLERV